MSLSIYKRNNPDNIFKTVTVTKSQVGLTIRLHNLEVLK